MSQLNKFTHKSNFLSKERRFKASHFVGLAIIAAILAIMLPQRYLALVLCFTCIHAIAVTGLDILFGYTGQISFGHAGLYAIGSYGSTLLSIRAGLPVWLSVLAGALLSALVGAIIAFPASRLVKHFLSLLTIAFGQMVFIIISITTKLTNGFTGISSIPPIRLFGLDFNTPFRFFILAAILLCLFLVLKANLIRSRIGRAFIAIRENTAAADGMGINVRYYKVLAFALSAFLCGFAGALYAHLMGFISPDTFNATTSNMFMTELLFGGIATITGPLVGSFILVVVTEVLQSLVRYQMLVYAAFILLVLFFMPNGVIGLIKKFIDKFKQRREARHAER